jgi:predicted Fe-Mo cluster-binding NifX family protein
LRNGRKPAILVKNHGKEYIMLIAVAADGQELNSKVSAKFETCKYLLIVETDTMSFEAIKNNGDSAELAQITAERDCEAVITGEFSVDTFNTLAEACITRYNGYGHTVRDALIWMDKNSLEYIRYADENDKCHGDHSGGECNCGEHDD